MLSLSDRAELKDLLEECLPKITHIAKYYGGSHALIEGAWSSEHFLSEGRRLLGLMDEDLEGKKLTFFLRSLRTYVSQFEKITRFNEGLAEKTQPFKQKVIETTVDCR